MDRDNLHHAYLVIGELADAREWLFSELKSMGVPTFGNPDFFIMESELFGVDDARSLAERARVKAFTPRLRSGQAGKKIFLLSPQYMTHEAQNALLKTFEEPAENTHFFLLVREEVLILPTLRSRMQVLRVDVSFGKHGQNLLDEAGSPQEFLRLSPTKRLKFAKKFADEEGDLPVFLDGLLAELKASSPASRRQATASRGGSVSELRDVYELRRYASDRSASSRLILEHLALILN